MGSKLYTKYNKSKFNLCIIDMAEKESKKKKRS